MHSTSPTPEISGVDGLFLGVLALEFFIFTTFKGKVVLAFSQFEESGD